MCYFLLAIKYTINRNPANRLLVTERLQHLKSSSTRKRI